MEKHPIGELMETTMGKLRDMVDVNTIIGQPITTVDGITLIPVSKLTAAYKKSLATLTGKVNNATFKGYDAGEVMFLGMSYTAPVKGQKKVMATYNFRISPNETNVKISGQTYSVSKKGWQYAWARSKIENDSTTGKPRVQIDGVYISDVCESADFSVLGL